MTIGNGHAPGAETRPRRSFTKITGEIGATQMKIAILVGTRPEIIKMAPVIRECQRRKLNYFIIHSKQHYSEKLDGIFFSELDLPAPKYNLNVGSGGHANQTGRILIALEPILVSEQPDCAARSRRHEHGGSWCTRGAQTSHQESGTSKPDCARSTKRCPKKATGSSPIIFRTICLP